MRLSWVASQALRRDSRGWEESGWEDVEVVVEGPRPARMVSCRPGAEGAPREVGWRWEWEDEWEEEGAMRIDWLDVSCVYDR